MVKKLFCAAMAAVALVGCNEKDVELADVQSGEKVQLTVTLPFGVTKVTGTPEDEQVNDIQIYVFDRNGIYETSSHAQSSTLSLTCTTGEKKIVALVNAKLEGAVSNIDELSSKVSLLSDCESDNIVMSGQVTKTLTANTTITMEVTRLAARVAVNGITTNFELDAHKNLSFKVKAIYLVNAAGDKAYLATNTPSQWFNKAKYIPETCLDFLYDQVNSEAISNGGTYATEHFFYCYPNSTQTKTRLVIEAEIGGYTYYYPLTLDSVAANTAYTYTLTITRLGSDSPDVPVADGAVNFTVTVKDWVQQNVLETI